MRNEDDDCKPPFFFFYKANRYLFPHRKKIVSTTLIFSPHVRITRRMSVSFKPSILFSGVIYSVIIATVVHDHQMSYRGKQREFLCAIRIRINYFECTTYRVHDIIYLKQYTVIVTVT